MRRDYYPWVVLAVAALLAVWSTVHRPERPDQPATAESTAESTAEGVPVEAAGPSARPPASAAADERASRGTEAESAGRHVAPTKNGVTRPEATGATAPSISPAADEQHVIRAVVLRDERGRVVFRGDVDLSPTLRRIDAGERLSFRNDGATFHNRERRLPAKASGYYREWVHPTPRVSGPGPQRVVTGREGEAYYTPDHYRSFQRLR